MRTFTDCLGTILRVLVGFFEVYSRASASSHQDVDFETFKATTLHNNGARTYSPNGQNIYMTLDGRTINFTPDVGRGQWGINSMDGGLSISFDMRQWGLAKGNIIDADGKGCVIIKNPAMKRALILDMQNPNSPKRSEENLTDGSKCSNI